MIRRVLAFVLVLGLAACGEESLDSKAEGGDPAAQFALGLEYEKGENREKDLQKAFSWYEAAANQDHVGAMYKMGVYVAEEGEGQRSAAALGVGTAIKYFNRDYARSAEWYQKASEKGSVAALYQLARLYYTGWGVDQDLEKAKDLAQQAKEKKYEPAGALLEDIAKGPPEEPFGEVRGNPHGLPGGTGEAGIEF